MNRRRWFVSCNGMVIETVGVMKVLVKLTLLAVFLDSANSRVLDQDVPIREGESGEYNAWEPSFQPRPAVLLDNRSKFMQAMRRVKGSSYHFFSGGYPVAMRASVRNETKPVMLVRLKGKKPRVKGANLEWMLNNIFMYPRSHYTNETAKETVEKFIIESFKHTSGIYTEVQKFKPIQFLEMYENSQLPTGTNIIGVIRGKEWGTARDKPVLVGAHWDTVNFTPGTDDNGSGVSAMLEAARAISHSHCKPKYSIIFAAFDLEEVGSQGSMIFIKDYLMNFLRTNLPNEVPIENFQGAFIMDTIMNFNETEQSQTFPTDWSLVAPSVYEQVANDNFKGDFLSMIYRRDVDSRMAETFHFHWGKSHYRSKYKLTPVPLMLTADLPELEILADHLNFLRSDHARFWYMNDTAVPSTFKAILMTDTGPYRGNMRQCYHTTCDGPDISLNVGPENIKFLTKITQVLIDTLVDMSSCALVPQDNVARALEHHGNIERDHIPQP